MNRNRKNVLLESTKTAIGRHPVLLGVSGDKTPLTTHEYKDASTDSDQIDHWWTQKPSSNIGIPTDGLLVLDIDVEAN